MIVLSKRLIIWVSSVLSSWSIKNNEYHHNDQLIFSHFRTQADMQRILNDLRMLENEPPNFTNILKQKSDALPYAVIGIRSNSANLALNRHFRTVQPHKVISSLSIPIYIIQASENGNSINLIKRSCYIFWLI